jgi:hypothetical protein
MDLMSMLLAAVAGDDGVDAMCCCFSVSFLDFDGSAKGKI